MVSRFGYLWPYLIKINKKICISLRGKTIINKSSSLLCILDFILDFTLFMFCNLKFIVGPLHSKNHFLIWAYAIIVGICILDKVYHP